jgi:hypothetical protein
MFKILIWCKIWEFVVTAANFCLRKRGGTVYKKACDAFGSFLKLDYAPSHLTTHPHILWEISTSSQLQVHDGGNKWTDPLQRGKSMMTSFKPARIQVIECFHQVPRRK